MQKEIRDDPLSPKTPEANVTSPDKSTGWHTKERERKDSAKRKLLTAAKCNEIVKNEQTVQEVMVDLKSLKVSNEEEKATRNSFTLADFGIKSKKKSSILPTCSTPQVQEVKIGWNMDNVELKPINKDNSDPFKPNSKKSSSSIPKPSTSSAGEKKFSSIIKSEKKEKENYEKIKSKSLILTQIEERAITELSEFYNITKIYDEDIKISRKVHVASLNLSSWHSGANV